MWLESLIDSQNRSAVGFAPCFTAANDSGHEIGEAVII